MKNCTQIIIALCICVFYPAIAAVAIDMISTTCRMASSTGCNCNSTNTGYCCPDTTVTCGKCLDGYKAATISLSSGPTSCRRETEYIASDSEHRYTVKTYDECDATQFHPFKYAATKICGQHAIDCLRNNSGTSPIGPLLPPATPVEL